MNLLQGFASAALMAYISASPFIFQNHFMLTPMQYSLCFACNAIGLVAGSSIIVKISNLPKAAQAGVIGLLATGLCISAALLQGWPFFLFEMVMFLMLFCVGILTPVAITLALNSVSENKGVASAMVGSAPFFLGGIVAPLTGIGGIGNMIYTLPLIIMLCALICMGFYWVSRRWDYSEPVQSR